MTVVAVVGAFDTKGDELSFLAEAIRAEGVATLLVDCGVLGTPRCPVDVSAAEVASGAGSSLTRLREQGDRAGAIAVMGAGARELLRRRFAAGEVHGLVGAGGSNGAALAARAAQALPFGIPKLIVSTMAAGDTRSIVNGSDIAMMYPLVDVEGLNGLTRSVLRRAGAAVGAMARVAAADDDDAGGGMPIVAGTMSGTTTACVSAARRLLERAGDEVLVFHANGVGGQSYERAIGSGRVRACLDVSLTEITDQVAGGMFPAGDERLQTAAARDMPQIVCPGGADMIKFGAPSTVPEAFAGRIVHRHNENVTLVRANAEESLAIGRSIGQRLAKGSRRTVIALPLGGVSALDAPDGVFWDPAADEALFDGIRQAAAGVRIVESPHHLNEPEFAELLVELLADLRHLDEPVNSLTKEAM